MTAANNDLASPALYPLTFDVGRRRVRFVTLDEEAYRTASFLGEPHLRDTGPHFWIPWPEIDQSAKSLSSDCDFIFQIGHVGSTFLSRLLGESDRVFALREPTVLRTLTNADLTLGDVPRAARSHFEHVTDVFLRLFGRTWRPSQRSLIKATSLVSDLGTTMMRLRPHARAILMLVAPSQYLETVLRTRFARDDVAATALTRLARLHARLGASVWRLEEMCEGEVLAMSWLGGCMALEAIAAAFPQRVMWVDFEDFLERPETMLATVLAFLHGAAPAEEVEAILRSPLWNRHSKSPGVAFDAERRRQGLGQVRERHSSQIARGEAWIQSARLLLPKVERAMGAMDIIFRRGQARQIT